MTFWEFVSEKFAAIAALFGILIGAGGTYLVQSKLLDRQREWALDDQKRQWERKRLHKLQEQINQFTSVLVQTRLLKESKQGLITASDMFDFLRTLAGLAASTDATYDDELEILVSKYSELGINLLDEDNRKPFEECQDELKRRINELLEQTYAK